MILLPLSPGGLLAVIVAAALAAVLVGCDDTAGGSGREVAAAARRAVDTRTSPSARPAERVIAGAFLDGFAVQVNRGAIYYVTADSVTAVNGIAKAASPGLAYAPAGVDSHGASAIVTDPERAVLVNGLN